MPRRNGLTVVLDLLVVLDGHLGGCRLVLTDSSRFQDRFSKDWCAPRLAAPFMD